MPSSTTYYSQSEKLEIKIREWQRVYLSSPDRRQEFDKRFLGLTQKLKELANLYERNRSKSIPREILEYLINQYETPLAEWYGMARAIDEPYEGIPIGNTPVHYDSISEQLRRTAMENMDSKISEEDKHTLVLALLSQTEPENPALKKPYCRYLYGITKSSRFGGIREDGREVYNATNLMRWLEGRKRYTTEDSARFIQVVNDMHSRITK